MGGPRGQVLRSYRPPGELQPEGTGHGSILTKRTVGLQDETLYGTLGRTAGTVALTTLRRHAVVAVLAGMAAILSGCPVRETFPSRALVSNERTETVWGHLSRPEGPRLAPAVVLLPACSGIANTPDWSALLTRWGYATLMVDSFGPRRAGSVCDQPGGGRIGAAQVLDAYGALEHLSRQPFVDRARIAVMGWSLGGLSALGAVLSEGLARTSDLRFRAAIAFYPKCGLLGPGQDFHAPVLILVGEKDRFYTAASV